MSCVQTINRHHYHPIPTQSQALTTHANGRRRVMLSRDDPESVAVVVDRMEAEGVMFVRGKAAKVVPGALGSFTLSLEDGQEIAHGDPVRGEYSGSGSEIEANLSAVG